MTLLQSIELIYIFQVQHVLICVCICFHATLLHVQLHATITVMDIQTRPSLRGFLVPLLCSDTCSLTLMFYHNNQYNLVVSRMFWKVMSPFYSVRSFAVGFFFPTQYNLLEIYSCSRMLSIVCAYLLLSSSTESTTVCLPLCPLKDLGVVFSIW